MIRSGVSGSCRKAKPQSFGALCRRMISYAILPLLFVGPLGTISTANASVDASFSASVATLWAIKLNAPEQYMDRINVEAQRLAQEAIDDPDFGMGYSINFADFASLAQYYRDSLIEAIDWNEAHRRDTCAAANADWADKNCSAARLGNRPRDNYDINWVFPFPDGYNYDYLRGAALAFHQALWDDLTGGTWNNYQDYIVRFYQACEMFAGGITAVSVGACKWNVDTYFGYRFFGATGLAAFQQSQAAIDAQSSRYGQVCTNLATVRNQNRCN